MRLAFKLDLGSRACVRYTLVHTTLFGLFVQHNPKLETKIPSL